MERSMQTNGSQSSVQYYEQLSNKLGWFSIALGLAEVAAPSQVAALIGVRDDDKTRNVLRAYGVRELTAGVGILTEKRPAGWLWARVGGDVLDLISLSSARSTDKARSVVSTAAVLGVTALDVVCAKQLSEYGKGQTHHHKIVSAVTINRPVEDVYEFWSDFERWPQFMRHIESVQRTGPTTSHWKARGPLGVTVEWNSEITHNEPNRLIGWRSVEGSDIHNAGRVRFEPAPGGRGTKVAAEIFYAPPGGELTAAVAKLLGQIPQAQIHDELRAFKQIMEVGEVVKSDASIHRGLHAAQPPEAVSV